MLPEIVIFGIISKFWIYNKDADYWKDIDENNEVFVWVKISTNGTKSINDDEAVVFPGNYSVFKDHAKIFILDGEIIVKEK